jgi:hypothetical protein
MFTDFFFLDVFFSVPDEEKEEWVKGLINGDF